jgi:DNA-binding NtrC family response regulator
VDAALEAVRRRHFDLIVCDYRMPGKTGIDLLAELEECGARIPVLMVSAFADPQTEATAAKLGAIGFLRKPFRRQQLLDSAARALP